MTISVRKNCRIVMALACVGLAFRGQEAGVSSSFAADSPQIPFNRQAIISPYLLSFRRSLLNVGPAAELIQDVSHSGRLAVQRAPIVPPRPVPREERKATPEAWKPIPELSAELQRMLGPWHVKQLLPREENPDLWESQMRDIYALTYASYEKAGYLPKEKKDPLAHYDRFDKNKNTTILGFFSEEGRLIGTLSITLDSDQKLTMDLDKKLGRVLDWLRIGGSFRQRILTWLPILAEAMQSMFSRWTLNVFNNWAITKETGTYLANNWKLAMDIQKASKRLGRPLLFSGIWRFAVLPEYQKGRVGRLFTLVAYAIAKKKSDAIFIEVNPHHVRFYDSFRGAFRIFRSEGTPGLVKAIAILFGGVTTDFKEPHPNKENTWWNPSTWQPLWAKFSSTLQMPPFPPHQLESAG